MMETRRWATSVIPFTSDQTQQQLSDAVAQAIRGTTLGLDAQNVGDGRVNLGGTPDVIVEVDNSDADRRRTTGPAVNPGGRQLVPIVYVPSSECRPRTSRR